jgi:hypothetical protein
MRPESHAAVPMSRRSPIPGPGFSGMLLSVHFLPAAGYFTPGLGIVGTLPGIRSLPYHRLMHYGIIEWHCKYCIAYLYILYYFSTNAINWDLHFLAPFFRVFS